MISPEIYPCILANSYQEYKAKLEMIETSLATWAQIDFMDGTFVSQRTILPIEIKEVETNIKLEAHLMVESPENYYQDLKEANFQRVLIHREIYSSLEKCQKAIIKARQYFKEVGLVINPDTEVEDYSGLGINSLQCMAVHPGASGQLLLDSIYDTIKNVKGTNPNFVIAVDGGVSSENIGELKKAGVERFIMASSIFANQDVNSNFQYFLQLITQGGI